MFAIVRLKKGRTNKHQLVQTAMCPAQYLKDTQANTQTHDCYLHVRTS